MKFAKPIGLTLLLALAPIHGAMAASFPEFDDAAFLDAMPMVLTATRLVQRTEDAPVSVFVIDRDMIEASGAREIADLLRLAPGFLVASVNGHQRTAGYHGFLDDYGRRLQVLIDGRSVYFPVLGGVRWSSLPLAIIDIERIEVIRGANSATHGANAFLGTVNFITRAPDTVGGVTAEILSGDPEMSQGVLRFGFGAGDVFSRLTLGFEADAGFPDLSSVDGPIERRDGKRMNSLSFRSDLQLDDRDSLSFSAGYKGGETGLGRVMSWGFADVGGNTLPYWNNDMPVRDGKVRQGFVQVDWQRELNPDAGLELHAYFNRFELRDRYLAAHYVDPGTGPLTLYTADVDNGRTESRFGLELQGRFQHRDGLRSVVGAEIRRDLADSTIMFRGTNGKVHDDMLRLFGNLEWQWSPSVVVNGGAMVEHHDSTGTSLSPRLGVNVHLDDRQTLRVAASRAMRQPSFLEQNADYYWLVDAGAILGGSPGDTIAFGMFGTSPLELEPERVDGLELAYLFDLALDSGLSGDIKLSHDRFRDMIWGYREPMTSHPDLPGLVSVDSDAAAFANQVDFDLNSLEFYLRYVPDPRLRVIMSAHFARMSGLTYDPTAWERDTTGNREERVEKMLRELRGSIPDRMLGLQIIMHPTPDWTASLSLHDVGAMQFLRTGDMMPAYTRTDLRLARSFRSGSLSGEVEAVWQSFTEDYFDFTNLNEVDSNLFEGRFYLGVKLTH